MAFGWMGANADAEFDAPLLRHAGVALDHRVLDIDRAAQGVDQAIAGSMRSLRRPL